MRMFIIKGAKMINKQVSDKYCNYCHNEIEETKGITSYADKVYHPECFELLNHFHYYDEFNEEFKD